MAEGGERNGPVEELVIGDTTGIFVQSSTGASREAVLLFVDESGVNASHNRRFAMTLAERGFHVIAPDLSRGEQYPPGSNLLEWVATHPRERVMADVRSAMEVLHEIGADKIGFVGMGWGGGHALCCAVREDVHPEAVVAFYPLIDSTDVATAGQVSSPTLILCGQLDEYFTLEQMSQLEKALAASDAVTECKVFVDQHHGFAMENTTVAREALNDMNAWLARHVNGVQTPAEEDWWPESGRTGAGRFYNVGLSNFEKVRAQWRQQTHPRPPPPPSVPVDVVFEGLANMRRTYELPGRMTLPDIIDVFNDIWEIDSGF